MRRKICKLVILSVLTLPFITACSTEKDFNIEGKWRSITKKVDENNDYSIVKKIEFDSKGLALVTYDTSDQSKIGYTFSSTRENEKQYGELTLNYTGKDKMNSNVLKIKDKTNQIKLDIGYPLVLERVE